MKKVFFCIVSTFYLLTNATAQTNSPTDTIVSSTLNGTILDEKNQQALPYANIITLNNGKGTISNEHGNFTIDIANLKMNDTIRFQCIGYKIKELTIERIANNAPILLSENIYTLDEVLVLGTTPDPVEIVKNILAYKDSNYRTTPHKKQVFIRERSSTEFEKYKISLLKNNIEELNTDLLEKGLNSAQKFNLSYSDFLGNHYQKIDEEGKIKHKVSPIKIVKLQEKEEEDNMDGLTDSFSEILNNTQDNEYWKLKTGILSFKVDVGESQVSIGNVEKEDTINTNPTDSLINDNISKEKKSKKLYNTYMYDANQFSSLNNEKQWDFLYQPNHYNYKITGGNLVQDEQVYIIDFTPKRRGEYEGRIYVSIETNAILRADYKYAKNKTGTNINLFGVGYKQSNFEGSIYFKKVNDHYRLKYLSYQSEYSIKLNRKFAFVKKQKRKFFDKYINKIKFDVDFVQKEKISLEKLVINQQEITTDEFESYEPKEKMEITYINQFDENLWKGYTTITPTKQMKEYKKLEE